MLILWIRYTDPARNENPEMLNVVQFRGIFSKNSMVTMKASTLIFNNKRTAHRNDIEGSEQILNIVLPKK